MALHRLLAVWVLALILAVPSIAFATPCLPSPTQFCFAVWLDGNPTPGGGGNGIPSSLAHTFGDASVTLVTTDELKIPGFLNSFDAVVISRFGGSTNLGTPLPLAAIQNIQAYVGLPDDSNQGGVVTFTNSAADSFFGAKSGAPFDANLNRLFTNAATNVAMTHHGYIGEMNGATMAMTTLGPNCIGFTAIGLLVGSENCGIQIPLPPPPPPPLPPVTFRYVEGPIGTGHPIDAGVDFPFNTAETTLFLAVVNFASNQNIVDEYGNFCPGPFCITDPSGKSIGGLPAIVANPAGIGFGVVPTPAPSSLILVGLGLAALAALGHRRVR